MAQSCFRSSGWCNTRETMAVCSQSRWISCFFSLFSVGYFNSSFFRKICTNTEIIVCKLVKISYIAIAELGFCFFNDCFIVILHFGSCSYELELYTKLFCFWVSGIWRQLGSFGKFFILFEWELQRRLMLLNGFVFNLVIEFGKCSFR